jgi:hypothetical protein
MVNAYNPFFTKGPTPWARIPKNARKETLGASEKASTIRREYRARARRIVTRHRAHPPK